MDNLNLRTISEAAICAARTGDPERRRIIRETVLDKIEERELAGYKTLCSSDITDIIERLKDENIDITRAELCELGLAED